MKPARLYIKDFMCYDNAYIDFSEFSAALIVGKMEHNDTISNGVGKSTIFRAIEYALFNHADGNLEDIIRDDTTSCNVTFDFIVNNQEYRISRSRTRKCTTDLTLFKRTNKSDSVENSLHELKTNKYLPISDEKYWADISGRRALDTEKELAKLIKANLKSFRIFVHFMQHDFSGLTTATPEKRKVILKDALNLSIYSKLEKLAKEKASTLNKEKDRLFTLIESLGDPDSDLDTLSKSLLKTENELSSRTEELNEHQAILKLLVDEIATLTEEHSVLEGKFSSLAAKEQVLLNEKNKLEISIKEYSSKKNNAVKSAHDLIFEMKKLEETQAQLLDYDYGKIDILTEEIATNREKIAQLNLTIQTNTSELEELKTPPPTGIKCDRCRQPLSEQHKKDCQIKLNEDREKCRQNISSSKKKLTELTNLNVANQQSVNSLTLSKQHLESVNTKIATKKKEISDKRTFHDEFSALLEKFSKELALKNAEIVELEQELQKSSKKEANELLALIKTKKQNMSEVSEKVSVSNKELSHFNSEKAVIQHGINQKTNDKRKKIDYLKLSKEIDKKLEMYPSVIQAFSSTGIPNLIIQNVLDDLQIEANTLLAQLKPGLQLSFLVEKTKNDGTEADTLDIQYNVNGKKRYYENLSGAMKLAVTFSLKLGLSFLLQKMIGVDIKFLLLDEIDQPLDKASVDAFADIVKFFQKDFTILVITHNDRLKDKFSHAILVEQDINMISKASVVSSW